MLFEIRNNYFINCKILLSIINKSNLNRRSYFKNNNNNYIFKYKMQHYTAQQVKDQLHDNQSTVNYFHYDVRDLDELKEDGYIPGTHNLPLSSLTDPSVLPPLADNCKLVFSCMAGKRSLKAAQKALEWGYKDVASMDGGFSGWRDAKLPVIDGGQLDSVLGNGGAVPLIRCFYDSQTGTCQYVVWCMETNECVVVDPVLDFDSVSWAATTKCASELVQFITSKQLKVKYILETHAHADHLSASQYLKAVYKGQPAVGIGAGIPQVQSTFARIFSIDKAELQCDGREFDKLFKSGEEFSIGKVNARALHVPGHTPDHLCYVIGDAVFTGDSIFMPDSGSARCDFPAGSAHQLFHSVREVLFQLPDYMRVFVGHDYKPNGRPLMYHTTIAEQKRSNKHVKLDISEAEFIEMRQARDKELGNPRLLYQSLNVNIRAGHFPKAKSELFPERPLIVLPITLAPEIIDPSKAPPVNVVLSAPAAAEPKSGGKSLGCG